MADSIELVLFDVGGVLVELGPSPVPEHLLPTQRRHHNWLHSEVAQAFECGLISANDFAAALIGELGLDCKPAEIIEHFRAWPRRLYPGSAELLERVRAGRRTAILTNTNVLHWPRFVDEFALPQRVERVFASHQLGLVKPRPEIFTRVAVELELDAAAILFIDDNPVNVDAAAAIGMAARCARGHTAVKQALLDYGILDANNPIAPCR